MILCMMTWLADNVITESPIASIGVGTAGLSIPGAKETFEAARKADKGILKSSLGVLGKGLTRVGSPAGTALFEIPFIAEQIQEGIPSKPAATTLGSAPPFTRLLKFALDTNLLIALVKVGSL